MAESPPASTLPPGLPARQEAWRVLEAVAAGAYADTALERARARSTLSPADRALATELALGSIRQRRLLDAWVDAHGKVRASRQPPRLRWLLHLGLYQLLFSQRIPVSAAVGTSVELAKRGGLGRLAPVVNGVLRSAARQRERTKAAATGPLEPWEGLSLPSDPIQSLGVCHSLPDWLAADLLQWLPADQAEAFARASNTAAPLDLRVQRLRTSREAMLAAFATAGIEAVPLPDTAQGITLPLRTGDLRVLPGYVQGLWCVQDRSAQRIAPLLDPHPEDKVLDVCAAPGGKSTHIAELMGDRGDVWALDRSGQRLERVRANAERLGLRSIKPLEADATRILEERPEWMGRFRRILLDAPCSGLGTLARHADARWRISPASIHQLVDQQRRLLTSVAPLLAPGGRLVYATCTVHPRENGDLVADFLAAQPGWQLVFQKQWWPGQKGGGDGFFAAVLNGPDH
jgi:16S rRNA (cytosine967-C5)-methyltransferase